MMKPEVKHLQTTIAAIMVMLSTGRGQSPQPNLGVPTALEGAAASQPPPVREGTLDLATGELPDSWNPIKPPPPYVRKSDEAAERLMNALLDEICDRASSGAVRSVTRTEAPESRTIFDEMQYVVERIVDLGLTVAGVEADNATSLSYLLFHSEEPSRTGTQNPFVGHTKLAAVETPRGKRRISRELALALKVLEAPQGSLEPAGLMRLALEVTEGDYPSATLTAHNFLKEVVYSGRGGDLPATFMNDPSRPADGDEFSKMINREAIAEWRVLLKGTPFDVMPMDNEFRITMVPGAPEIASRLVNLRVSDDPHYGDKLGPWYHAFGVLFLSSTAKGGRYTAQLWADTEGAARHIPGMPSKPDYFKELFTSMAGRQSGAILDCIRAGQTNVVEIANSVVILIDASASMKDGGKIESAIATAGRRVAALGPETELAVIAFSGNGVSTPFLAMTPRGRARAQAAIGGIRADGGTPLAAGIRRAGGFLRSNARGKNLTLVVLSDGEETAGGDPPAEVRRLNDMSVVW